MKDGKNIHSTAFRDIVQDAVGVDCVRALQDSLASVTMRTSSDRVTEDTIPAGLLNDHQTKEGTWGLICVEEGELRYIVTDRRRTPSEMVLSRGAPPGVVEPTILHHVEPMGAVRFHVEFYSANS